MADQRRALIAVLGGPGAGKTSQCARLARELGYTHLSAGQALKSEAASGGAHAEVIASCQKAGTLVPSETVSSVLRQRLAESSGPVLLDGVPSDARVHCEVAGSGVTTPMLLHVPDSNDDETSIGRHSSARN